MAIDGLSIAVSGGRIYTTGDNGGAAWLFVLDEADGKHLWKAKLGRAGRVGFMVQPPGPRATATVESDRAYILARHGKFVCLTTDGKEVWRTHFVEDLGGIVPV